MKVRLSIQLLAALTLTAGATLAFVQSANAGSKTFFCAKKHGIPRTFVQTRARGKVSLIRWQSPQSQGGLSPMQRCNIVSRRLQTSYENRTLEFIRTGNVDNSPVLCFASQKGGVCPRNRVLLTLRQGTDPDEVLDKLLNLRSLGSTREVYLSGSDVISYAEGETYVSVDRFLEVLETDGGDGNDTGNEIE